MNFLITGGTGFIGTYLIDFLIGQGHNIAILSRNKNKVSGNIKAMSNVNEIKNSKKLML